MMVSGRKNGRLAGAGKLTVCAALMLMAVWWLGSDYALGQLVFVTTYAIAGLGLVLIAGQCGQISLGQGALFGLGAYAQTLLVIHGWPALAALFSAMILGAAGGWLASLPARRLGGLFFAMSTLAFGLIVEEVLVRWESLTHGAAGLIVSALQIGGRVMDTPLEQLLVSVAMLLAALFCCRRWCVGATGRSWRAVREDETAAQACGIDTARVRMQVFVAGGGLTGIAGGLYAHWIGFISPEQFGLSLSFELLMLAFIGGIFRLSGALWGALVIVAMPQLIAVARDLLPLASGNTAGVELLAFGAVIVAMVLWRPQGIAGSR